MLPVIQIGKYQIASYGLLILVGFVAAIFLGIQLGKKRNLQKEDVLFAFFYGILGVVVGGKLLYLMVNIPNLIVYREFLFQNPEAFYGLLQGGFVFYGGLFGGVYGIYRYCKRYQISIEAMFYTVIPGVPLIHGIGRIGCFAAGCCYGIEYHGIGSVTFEHSIVAPNQIPLFPVQILESVLNIILFLFLLWQIKRGKDTLDLVLIYGFFYGLLRLILEFFRGDSERGIFFFFSTSQWISFIIVFITFTIIIRRKYFLKYF